MKTYHICAKDALRTELVVKDMYNSVIYTIKQAKSLVSNKIIVRNKHDEMVAEITRIISLIVPKYKVDIKDKSSFYVKRRLGFCVAYDVDGMPWEVLTDSTCEKYLVNDNQQGRIYEIRKEKGGGKINYNLDVIADTDEITGVCITVAVDAAMRAIYRV